MKLSIIKTISFVFFSFFGLFLITPPVFADQASCEAAKYAGLGNSGFQPQTLNVGFKPGISQAQATTIVQSYGFNITDSSLYSSIRVLTVGNVPMGQEVTYACRLEIERASEVAYAELNMMNYSANAPNIGGEVRNAVTGSNAGFTGLWVKWSSFHNDGAGLQEFIRYTQVDGNGRFLFSGWTNISQGQRDGEFNRQIDTNLDGSPDARQANTNVQGHFGCESNPHTFTVVKPAGWSGSFSTVTININNGTPNLSLQINYDPNTSTSTPTPAAATYTLSGYVFSDNNNSGGFDAGDSGMPGEVVQLLSNSNGQPITEGGADGNGFYSIGNIAPNGYTAAHKAEPLWAGWVRTTPRTVGVDLRNSNVSASFGMKAYMEGYVYEDNNRDGVFNSGDVGLWLSPVQLLNNGNGAVTKETITTSTGYYKIDPVPYYSGGYTVVSSASVPANWFRTTPVSQQRGMYNFGPASFGLDNVPSGGSTPTPPPPPPSTPTVSLSANPATITSGQSSTLSWASSNATSCTASNGWSGAKGLSGNEPVSPTANATYTITCTGPGGSANASASISVNPAPTTLSGRVYRETSGGACSYTAGVDVPLAGQVIELDPYFESWSWYVATDANGNYTIANIPPNWYYARYSTIPANTERVDPPGFDVLLDMSTNRTQDFCIKQIPPPTVNFSIVTNDGISSNDAVMTSPSFTRVPVKAGIPTTISWTISTANTVSNNWSPAIAAPGAGSVSGSFTVPTNAPNNLLYTLTVANSSVYWGTGTFQVEVGNPSPFIQTTGGDVHTNETINITPP